MGKRRLDALSVQGGKACFANPFERLPPPRADRIGPRHNVKVKREMGEHVSYGAKRAYAIGRFFAPIASRKRGHSAKQALGRAPHEPDAVPSFDPICDPVPVRPHWPMSPFGE